MRRKLHGLPAQDIAHGHLAVTELSFEDVVFFEHIQEDLLLVALNPTGHYGNQHVEDHDLSSGWRP
jgi:hypothetical protein